MIWSRQFSLLTGQASYLTMDPNSGADWGSDAQSLAVTADRHPQIMLTYWANVISSLKITLKLCILIDNVIMVQLCKCNSFKFSFAICCWLHNRISCICSKFILSQLQPFQFSMASMLQSCPTTAVACSALQCTYSYKLSAKQCILLFSSAMYI